MIDRVLAECQVSLPGWRGLGTDAFDFAPPKGFSTFTMAARAKRPLSPPAVLYRRLAGKDNAILDASAERAVFLTLAEAGIAPRCLHYDPGPRLEAFYEGSMLCAEDLFDPATLRGVAGQLYRCHHVASPPLPAGSFFELPHARWAPLARHVLVDRRAAFPDNEMVRGGPPARGSPALLPQLTDAELEILIGAYLDHGSFPSASARERELQAVIQQILRALPLSDDMYAMAALPLALEPVQRIRSLPYAHQHFERFLAACP